jgi:thiol-disulfide isomerase/thioredoxin
MMIRHVFFGSALLAVAATTVVGVLAASGNGPARAIAHTPGTTVSLGGTNPISRKHLDLASLRGKPIVLNVWSSWCTECNAEAGELERFARTHRNAQLIGVDVQDTRSGAVAFYRRWHWRHPSIADPQGDLAARLAVRGLPTTFFLNSRHEIVSSIVGAADLAGFDHGLRLALGQN